MGAPQSEGPKNTFGNVITGPTSASDDEFTCEYKYCVWRPHSDLRLPEGFELKLKCLVGTDGVRRFSPCLGHELFVMNAALAGQAILERCKSLSREQRASYGLMRLIYQQQERLQERFRRRFTRISDLRITKAARTSVDEADVLPDWLGLDSNGRGIKWSDAELVRRGKQAIGNDNVDDETCIRHGLIEAARLNPIDVSEMTEDEETARRYLRVVLFDLGPASESSITEETKKLVEARLLAAIDKHLDDDTR
jgi:hypothetical protein